jgi:hypothetical protein
MTEEYDEVQLVWLANIFGIPTNDLRKKSTGDVWVRDSFRLGNISGLVFIRENPVFRTLARRDVEVHEGMLNGNHEPQYDLRFYFNPDSSINMMSDQRTSMEYEWNRKKEKNGDECTGESNT